MDRRDSHTSGRNTADAHDYYLSVDDEDVQVSFQCLDDPSNLNHLMDEVRSTSTGNFIVDFSDDTAWAAFDLPTTSIKALFDADRPESLNARWLNIWYPFQHQSLLEFLARRYDFSPRLFGLMCSNPKVPRNPSRSTLRKPVQKRRLWQRSSTTELAIETGANEDEISEQSSVVSPDSMAGGNLYRVADNIWHYSSVDLGRQFVCIGFNSLYGTKHSAEDIGEADTPLPQCTRVWTWLLICEDNTVISINEDPFPFANGHFSNFQLCILKEVRRNLVNVFRSLSTVYEEPFAVLNPMMLLPIRNRMGHTPEETAHRASDAPGLLFYYLFENWYNSYTLVTRKESRYGIELSKLRADMFDLPKLEHIDRLDRMGKELAVLRRHYEAYNRIIDRLLETQIASAASLQNSQVVMRTSQASMDTVRPFVTERRSLMGVSLGSAARVRFRRLRDLIDLYALSEVEGYIKQKEAMVSMVSLPTNLRVFSPIPSY